MSQAPVQPETAKGLTGVGLAGSALWLVLLGTYVLANSSKVLDLEPNEVGDFLAGAFAPLAFFWLVLGFFQQGSELRNSGRALWLQGEELRNSVEQQRQLVNVTREQGVSDHARAVAEQKRARQLAQPKLELALGGWGSSLGARNQRFGLANYGRPCTQVRVQFDGDWQPRTFDQLDTGKRSEWDQTIVAGQEQVMVTVSYLDQHLEPGTSLFEITFVGLEPKVRPVALPSAETQDPVTDGAEPERSFGPEPAPVTGDEAIDLLEK